MNKIIVILGPTGVGKSKLAISVAKKYNASVINADATQIYKEANIGTAKITREEMQGVPHYMLDQVNLDEDYSVARYQKDARKILDELIKKNENVVIVGGTGLYIKALLYDYRFSLESKKTYDYSSYTNQELKDKVDEIYKENDIHVNNRKRLERFLIHYNETGEVIKNNYKDQPLYDFICIGLSCDKKEYDNYLSMRIYNMIMDGFIEEANVLANYDKVHTFIGYKEILDYSNKKTNLSTAINNILTRTKQYAKRQYTWFNNQFDNVKWFQVDYNNFDKTKDQAIKYIDSF